MGAFQKTRASRGYLFSVGNTCGDAVGIVVTVDQDGKIPDVAHSDVAVNKVLRQPAPIVVILESDAIVGPGIRAIDHGQIRGATFGMAADPLAIRITSFED